MSTDSLPTVHLIGPGRAGRALLACLAQVGYPVGQVVARRAADAASAVAALPGGTPGTDLAALGRSPGVVLLAVPDDALDGLVEELSRACTLPTGTVVLHLSGARSSDLLAPLRAPGVTLGSLHPIRSFADREHPPATLAGTGFAVEGDRDAVARARTMVEDLGGFFLPVSTAGKGLHHLASMWCSNAVVALFHAACELERKAGADGEQARSALLPLLRSTVENLEVLGAPQALTGPVERGDLAVLRQHRDEVRAQVPEQERLFQALCERMVQVAQAKGSLDDEAAGRLRALLEGAP